MKTNSGSIETQIAVKALNRFKVVTLFLIVALLFAPVLLELIKVWSTDDDYSHGFLVIPISLYMVWKKRQKLLSLPTKPLWIGLPIFTIGVIAYLVSFVTKFHTLTHLSIIVIILGLLLFLTGWHLTKEVLLPLLFLLFMFPIPSAYYILITNPLKLIITKISTQIVHLLGIPVYRDGNLLFFSNSQFEVAEACSGVRSLYAYIMLGCLLGLLSRKRAVMVVLVVSTVPLALLVNIIRVTGTAILSNYYGPEVAQEFFHQFTGLVPFIFGFVVLFLEYHLLHSIHINKTP